MSEWHKLHRIADTGPAPHKLTSVNKENKTATCSVCGPVKIVIKQGSPTCWTRHKEWQRRYRLTVWEAKREAKKKFKEENALPSGNDYRRFLKPSCERCGFKAKHECQLDIHHKDHDHKNNHMSNLETLCPACHRLEHLPEDVKAGLGVDTNTPSNGLESKGMEVGGASGGMDEVTLLKREIDVLKEELKREKGYKSAATFKEAAGMDKTTPMDMEKLALTKKLLEREGQLSQMTRSYEEEFKRAESLVMELDNARTELQQVASWTEDDKTKYWRNRALMAEQQLKGKTNEYDQG